MSWIRPIRWTVALLVLAGLWVAPAVRAEEKAAASVKDEMLFWISDAESKLNELAEATPEDKYGWRPAEGVRSTGEVFLHVAAANFGMPSFWGVTPPEGFKFEGYEASMTKKADIQNALKTSFAHMKKSLESADDATFAKQVKLFGMESSVRGVYMLMLSHAHEHLGQSIAYARSNGIAPPWTARQNEQIEAAKAQAKEAGAKKDEHKH